MTTCRPDRREVIVLPDMRRAKVPLSRVMAGPYGHPYHPALVSLPIGAWAASMVFDICSHLVSKPAFLTTGSEWLIAIGIVGAIIAGLAGFMDLALLSEGTPAYRTASAHMVMNLLVTVLYTAGFWWRHQTTGSTAPVGAGMLGLSAVCLGLLTVSAYLGGRLTYGYGMRVADEATQARGYLARDRAHYGRRGEVHERPHD